MKSRAYARLPRRAGCHRSTMKTTHAGHPLWNLGEGRRGRRGGEVKNAPSRDHSGDGPTLGSTQSSDPSCPLAQSAGLPSP